MFFEGKHSPRRSTQSQNLWLWLSSYLTWGRKHRANHYVWSFWNGEVSSFWVGWRRRPVHANYGYWCVRAWIHWPWGALVYMFMLYLVLILYQFIFLQLPYANRKNNARGNIFLDIRNKVPPARRPSDLHIHFSDLWNILEECWQIDPSERPSAGTVQASFHQWYLTLLESKKN